MAQAEADRATAEEERTRAAREAAEAQQLAAEADRATQAAETARAAPEHEQDSAVRGETAVEVELETARATVAHKAGKATYDSAERRHAFAADLKGRGIQPETVAARMTADVSQGTRPSDAVKAASKKAPKARKSTGTKPQHELSR